jgi:hypothetical protein
MATARASNSQTKALGSPDTPGCDYEAIAPHWHKAEKLLDGLQAMRCKGELYLPRCVQETGGTSKVELRVEPASCLH